MSTSNEKLACGHTRSEHQTNGGDVFCVAAAGQELFGNTFAILRRQARADEKIEATLEELRGPSISMDLAAANRLNSQLAHANRRQKPEPVLFDRPESARANVATICGWCLVPGGRLNIMRLQRHTSDVVSIILQNSDPTDVSIFRNGERLEVSKGCCPGCRAKTLAEHQANGNGVRP